MDSLLVFAILGVTCAEFTAGVVVASGTPGAISSVNYEMQSGNATPIRAL